MNKSSIKEVDKYCTQDYQNLYRCIKFYNLICQLYNSDSLTQEEFKKEEAELFQKYKNVKSHIGSSDFEGFAILFDIEKQYQRIQNHNKDKNNNNKIEYFAIHLTSKSIQILDLLGLHSSSDMTVSEISNHLLQIVMLLKNYKSARKNISVGFLEVINKINCLYEAIKKKSVMDILPRSDYCSILDLITKMRHQLLDHANRHPND